MYKSTLTSERTTTNTAVHLISPGRTAHSTMGAPNPPDPVEFADCACQRSRPGPAVAAGSGVSQQHLSGKYTYVRNVISPNCFSSSSNPPVTDDDSSNAPDLSAAPVIRERDSNSTAAMATQLMSCDSIIGCSNSNIVHPPNRWTPPGRTVYSTLEAPEPLNSVVLDADSSHRSRPGPEVEIGEGVFQPVLPGKYSYCRNISLSDMCSRSSSLERDGAFPGLTASDNADSSSEIRMYYQNVRGLRTKTEQVFLSTSELDYDIYVFTETWLDDRIQSGQLFNNDYYVYRTDRCTSSSLRRRGGGVLIAVKRKYASSVVHLNSTSNIEQLWVKIVIKPLPLFICALYIPPDKSQNSNYMQLHIDAVCDANRMVSDMGELIVFGDFNQPRLIWKSSSSGHAFIDPLLSQTSMASQILLDSMAFLGLRQRNLVRNCSDRVLDLIFSSDSNMTNGTVTLAAEEVVPIDRYHPALSFSAHCVSPVSFHEDVDLTERDFRRADYDTLNELLSQADWSEVYRCSNVDGAVSSFNNILLNGIIQSVPLKRPPNNPPWSNAHLRTLRRRRSKLLQRYCRQRCIYVKRQFDEASRIYRGYNRFLYKMYVRRRQDDLRRNPKRFWNFVNSKRKESGLPTSMHLGDVQANSAEAKCELFSQQFGSVFENRVPSAEEIEVAVSLIPRDAVDLDLFNINSTMVESALQKLKQSYQPGPDGIPSCVFKRCSALLVAPLQAIFNQSLQQQRFPSAWKASHMLPVHKKGDKSDISNYRGITSLSAGSKCFEIIVNEVLFNACTNYISASQHGFYPKRSVDSNLCEFTSFCIGTMDDGAQVDAVYTDIKAAFDTVSHDILLAKLLRLGISNRICNWLRSYLNNRQLYVKIGSSVSASFAPSSGVPQGSNLGPLLFLLFFNDVTILLTNGGILIYADDLKIYLVVRNEADCRRLQELLDQFADWCSSNFLKVSISKCCIISYRRCKNPILHNYTINGQELERVDKVKDLGVLLDHQLTFKIHYSNVVDKANRQLGFILKIAKDFNDPVCLRALYCSLVRSILEFASVIWSPYEAVWISRIESVQRKFVRHALRSLPWRDPVNLPPYEHRCALLGIETLANRRKTNQAVFGAKILRAEIDSSSLLDRMRIYAPERVLRSRQLLQLTPRNTIYGSNDPVNSICRQFQEGYHVFDFNLSTNTFRQRLRSLHVFH